MKRDEEIKFCEERNIIIINIIIIIILGTVLQVCITVGKQVSYRRSRNVIKPCLVQM
jgi:hypothetical protein